MYSATELLELIERHHLAVRCLPLTDISKFRLIGAEDVKLCAPIYDESGKLTNTAKSIIIEKGGRFLREEKPVQMGGWWIVKEANNSMARVDFNKCDWKPEIGAFFAPTLEGAIRLYLDNIKTVSR